MTQMKYATVYANEFLQNEIKQMPTNETKWNEMQNTSQTIKTNFFFTNIQILRKYTKKTRNANLKL